MSVEDPTDWFKLTAYFAGDGTPAERQAFEQWLGAIPERQQLANKLRVIWEASNRPLEVNRDVAMTHVMMEIQRLGADTSVRAYGRTPSLRTTDRTDRVLSPWTLRSRTRWHVISGLALSAMLLAAGWAIGHHRAPDRTHRTPLAYSTGPGERANITLPDSSTVVLDVASRLEVPAEYVAGNHTLRLTGEALFTVSRHDGTPFTVLAGGAAARVLGTSFLVRHYASDTTTTVAVRDGKVTVGPTVLAAHQLIEVNNAGAWQVAPADAAEFSFATGTLTLPEMPLAQAIPELDRWYDADIRLGDSTLAPRHIVGEFVAGSLADIRAILAMTFNARVIRDGKTLTLYPR